MDNLRTTGTSCPQLPWAESTAAKTAAPAQVGADHSPRTTVLPRIKPAKWPKLDSLGLTEAQRLARRDGIGGSDANIILSGDPIKIRDLWLEKRGEAAAPDLSDRLAVMLGCWTEPFNRMWFEQLSAQKVTKAGRSFTSQRDPWRRCIIDGLVEGTGAVFEAKHTSAFTKPEEAVERYMPQLQHNMAVTGSQSAVLSVIFGNHKFEMFEIASDWLYQIELLDAEQQFWKCVLSGEEPVAIEPPPTLKPVGTREICLEGNNSWASSAFDWLKYREAAKAHATACTSIKALVEDDVSRAFGHGIEAKRSKSGAITIRELA